jgi:RNA polymerase sigma-70 factor (ECF subfamily)
MGRHDIERQFERFRQKGDAEALERVFDATAPELLRVAMHLSKDAARAEDLVQGTFVAAIEHAHGWDGERRLMPWLLGILARQAARARREAARSPDPELVASPSTPDPVAASEAAELAGALTGALDGLPSPYREVLAPHLLDGKRAVDIARELERAPGTVRMQILRGLELLRNALPPSLATGFLLSTGTRGEAAVRAAVLEKAAQTGPALAALGAASVTTPLLFLGGITMSVKVVLGIVGAAGAVAATWIWASSGSGPAAAPAAAIVIPERTALVEPVADAPRATTAEIPAAAERAAVKTVDDDDVAEVDAAPGWWLVGTLRGLAPDLDSPPVINVFCQQSSADTVAALPNADGTFEVDLSDIFTASGSGATRELLVSINHPAYLVANASITADEATTRADPGARTEIHRDIDMFPASGVEGRVVVPTGHPMNTVSVVLFHTGEDGAPGDEVRNIEPEPDGTFGIHKREPGSYLVAASSEGLMPAFEHVYFAAGEIAHPADLVLEAGAVAIQGRLELLPGMPLAGCRVEARRTTIEKGSDGWHWATLEWRHDHFELSMSAATTDAEGNFELTGLRPGRHALTLNEVPGIDAFIDIEPLESPAPATGVLLAPELARLTIEVTSAGEPVAESKVQVVNPPYWHDVTTQPDGRCTVLVDAATDYSVYANKEGFETRSVELPAEARALDLGVPIELPPSAVGTATLVFEPHMRGEAPLERIKVNLTATEDTPYSHVEEVLTLTDGVFTLRELHPGPYQVEIEPDEDAYGPYYASWYRSALFHVTLVNGEIERRTIDFAVGGRLRLTVVGFEGGEVENTCQIFDDAGSEMPVRYVMRSFEDNIITIGATTHSTFLDHPAEVYPNLLPGSYLIRLEIDGYAPLERTVRVPAGELTEVELHVQKL